MTSFAAATATKNCEDNREQDEKERTSQAALRGELSATQRDLLEVINCRQMGPEGLRAAQPHLLKLFGRIERLNEQIDHAFGGQAFLPNVGPASPANRRRFNAYFEYHRKVSRLLFKAIEVWALTCGMKMDDDWVPMMIVYMSQQAAKARANANRGAMKD